jgi:integrase
MDPLPSPDLARIVRELVALAQTPSVGPDVDEVLDRYQAHAEGYYRKHGRPTSEPAAIEVSMRPLRAFYGATLARDFGPLALKAVRQAMIDSGLCRNEVNKRVGRIVRAFRWAVAEELVPPSVHQGLAALAGLRAGRTEARESGPVQPVPEAFVGPIRPHVARQVWAMVELQLASGMRPGEACAMRTCDLDVSGRVWAYTPWEHKTEHHGKERRIFLGPRAQEVLRPWLRLDLTAWLFSPAEATSERRAGMRARRKSKVQPSQISRAKADPRRAPGTCYTVTSYRQAIVRGCRKAGVPAWHPNQLRHTAATRIRRELGLDAARVILGHSSAVVTEVYAERDQQQARDAMERLG